jgi:YggT family protein
MMHDVIDRVFDAVYIVMIVRVFLSWIPHNPYHPIIRLVMQITNPILEPFQSLIPPVQGIDFSPMIAFIFLGILKSVIMSFI